MRYECECGYIYDEAEGDPGTTWDDLPKDFVCPVCGAGKEVFELI
jgi:rubredoxin